MSSSIAEIQLMLTLENENISTYSITVNCTINPGSTANLCEVMVTTSNYYLIGNKFNKTLSSIKLTCTYCIFVNESLGIYFLLCIVDLVLK